MEIGFIGLGRMGLNMTIRLLQAGHTVVATTREQSKVAQAVRHGARPAATPEDVVRALGLDIRPRHPVRVRLIFVDTPPIAR